MLISLLMGKNMSWTAIAAAVALIVLDFKDAQPCLEKVMLTACWKTLNITNLGNV